MPTRLFECTSCNAFGKIIIKSNDYEKSDIVYCPVCSGDIFEDEEYENDNEEN